MKKRKALFLLSSYRQGGAERQAVYLARWLRAEAGFDVNFVALRDGGAVADELRNDGFTCDVAGFDFYFIDHIREFRWNKSSVSLYFKLRREWIKYAAALKKYSPDVILPFTYYPNVVAGLAWKESGAKLSLWNQRDIGTDGMNGSFTEKLSMKRTPFFISNSKQGADLLRDQFSVAAAKIDVIPNGIIIPDSVSTPASAFGLSADDEHVVMLANFHPYKDHETLVKAWKMVTDKFPSRPLKLVLAGRFGGTENKLMEICANIGIRDKVVFLDSVKDVNGLLHNAVMSAFSSYNEGHPNAVLEAMAMALPVAATDIPGCRDALGNDYPFLSKSGDAETMAANIIALFSDKELMNRTGAQNLDRIRTEYSIEKMGRHYLRIIDRFC